MIPFPAYLRLLRPAQWIKNSFVLAGIFFAGAWNRPNLLFDSLTAFLAFCLAASAVYCLNDALDADEDRRHPRKRLRPVAAGLIPRSAALAAAGILALGSLAACLWVGPRLLIATAAYFGINALYSNGWKEKVLIDVFCIASGFILRLLAGTWGIGIEPSQWFLLCAMALSLFLGFSKRYAELMDRNRPLAEKRQVLANYSPEFLRLLMGITLAAALITYGLYTTSPRTIEVHHTTKLIYTLPLVMFGLFRYLYLVMQREFGESAEKDFFRDRQMILASALYLAITGGLLFIGSAGGR